MPLKPKYFHIFLVLAAFHLLLYYLFFGESTLEIHNDRKGFLSNELFNYFLSVSVVIIGIWITYWIYRSKLSSQKLIWLHLIIVFITVFILPFTVLSPPMPRRYYDFDLKISLVFGSMSRNFTIIAVILLLSELLLLLNIGQQKPKINS